MKRNRQFASPTLFVSILLLFLSPICSSAQQRVGDTSDPQEMPKVHVSLSWPEGADQADRTLPSIVGIDSIAALQQWMEGDTGRIQLGLTIDENGDLTQYRIMWNGQDPASLSHVLDGVRQLKYSPGRVKGENTLMEVIAEVRYGGEAEGSANDVIEDSDLEGSDVVEPGSVAIKKEDYPDYVPKATRPTYDPRELLKNLDYPSAAVQNGEEGIAIVKVWLDEEGTVVKTEVLDATNPSFGSAAVKAILKTRFSPATLDRKPIKLTILVTVKFKL